ncbi:MAG: rRNA pseudouridine synthase [Acidobacteriales bacterium]|nr:rRNA pseudouridine synthase [Terriglobales bacterium]
MPAERLQKIIAAAGIASRRKAEEMIAAGLVTVNGQTVTTPGTKADPEVDHIKVGGKLIQGAQRSVYLVVNKPKGYVTTLSDPEGRKTVLDLIGNVGARVYPVGRLDYASEGLLLLTNDGDLAHKLMRAATHVPKVYWVKVSRAPQASDIEKLRRGVNIEEDGKRVTTAPARIQSMREGDNPWFEVTLIEGRNRQIRKMFEAVGHLVEKIKRVQYGPIKLDIETGESRALGEKEVALLKNAAEGQWQPAPPPERERMASKKKDLPAPGPAKKPIFARADFVRKGIAAKGGFKKKEFGARTDRPAGGFRKRESGPKRFGRPDGAGKEGFDRPRSARPGGFKKEGFGGPRTSRPGGFKKEGIGGPRSARPAGFKKRSFGEKPFGKPQGFKRTESGTGGFAGKRDFRGKSSPRSGPRSGAGPEGSFKKDFAPKSGFKKKTFGGPRDFKKKSFGAKSGSKRQGPGGKSFGKPGGASKRKFGGSGFKKKGPR